MHILIAADTSFRGPFTHNEPLANGETKLDITNAQYDAIAAAHATNPGAPLAFNGTSFVLAPSELARRARVAAQRALLDKLAADTITAAELRELVKHLVRRIKQIEQKLAAVDE